MSIRTNNKQSIEMNDSSCTNSSCRIDGNRLINATIDNSNDSKVNIVCSDDSSRRRRAVESVHVDENTELEPTRKKRKLMSNSEHSNTSQSANEHDEESSDTEDEANGDHMENVAMKSTVYNVNMSNSVNCKVYVNARDRRNRHIVDGSSDDDDEDSDLEQGGAIMQEMRKLNHTVGLLAHKMNEQMDSLNRRHGDLLHRFNRLEHIIVGQHDFRALHYTMLQSHHVFHWISSIYGGRFKKYASNLQSNIVSKRLIGSSLKSLSTTDLHELGVINFQDKQLLLQYIRNLV